MLHKKKKSTKFLNDFITAEYGKKIKCCSFKIR